MGVHDLGPKLSDSRYTRSHFLGFPFYLYSGARAGSLLVILMLSIAFTITIPYKCYFLSPFFGFLFSIPVYLVAWRISFSSSRSINMASFVNRGYTRHLTRVHSTANSDSHTTCKFTFTLYSWFFTFYNILFDN